MHTKKTFTEYTSSINCNLLRKLFMLIYLNYKNYRITILAVFTDAAPLPAMPVVVNVTA